MELLLGNNRVLREWDTEEICFVGKGNYEKQGELFRPSRIPVMEAA